MPKVNRRHPSQRGWNDSHKDHLRHGSDLFREAWGREPAEGWPAEILTDMRLAWERFADELLAEYADKLERPWGWWKFDAAPEIIGFVEASTFDTDQECEADALDRAGLLTPEALAKAGNDRRLSAGPLCDSSFVAFRRRWHWWRFTSPERRDHGKPEAVQLVAIERNGGEVLTAREQYIAAHRADPYAERVEKRGAVKVFLTPAEVEALGLPATFIEPVYEDDEAA
jgi:hypothetical protein